MAPELVAHEVKLVEPTESSHHSRRSRASKRAEEVSSTREAPGRETTKSRAAERGGAAAAVSGDDSPEMSRKPQAAFASSVASLYQEKAALKRAMRQWELNYEEQHSGLVPTHFDKKDDAAYRDIKAQAKRVEAALDAKRMSAATEGVTLARPANAAQHATASGGDTGFDTNTGANFDMQDGTVTDMQGALLFEEIRVDVSPGTVFALFLATALPYALFVANFSLMGYGEAFYEYLTTKAHVSTPATCAAGALLFALYMLDVSYWRQPSAQRLRTVLLSVCGATFALGALLATKRYPYAPIMLFVLFAPGYWWMLYVWAYHGKGARLPMVTFLRALCFALLLLSSLSIGIWAAWYQFDNNWDTASKERYMMEAQMCCIEPSDLLKYLGYDVGLQADNQTLLDGMDAAAFKPAAAHNATDGSWVRGDAGGLGALADASEVVSWAGRGSCVVVPAQPCMTVLLFWIAPFATGAAGYIAAGIAYTLARQLMHESREHSGIGPGPRLFIMGLTVAVAALWIAAQLAGANMGMSRVVLLGVAALLLVLGVLAHRFFGFHNILASIMISQPLARQILKAAFNADLTKAVALLFFAPLGMLAVGLSVANQFVRVHLRRTTMPDEHRRLWLTPRVAHILDQMRLWNWTSVLRLLILAGLMLLILNVGVMKVTTVFMSYLVKKLKPLNVFVSTLIFSTIGLSMFLLPPVPGAPVYLAAGVLLTVLVESSIGFYGGMIYATAVGFVIKLVACTMQQKLIGENLARYPAIRRAVQINSPVMRAIKLMMSRPGITVAKVVTLVGGPDWPTSVMMGLMGMPLAPILLGTTPIVALIAPLAFSGGFMTRGPQAPYPALMNVALSLSTMTQGFTMLKMAQIIEKTTFECKDEIRQMPYDDEVLILDRSSAEHEELVAEIVHWRSGEVPPAVKRHLIVGALLMVTSYQIQLMLGASCFRDFSLYPDYDTQLRDELGGKLISFTNAATLGLVMPLGWLSLAAACVATFLFHLSSRWATRYVREQERTGRKPKKMTVAGGGGLAQTSAAVHVDLAAEAVLVS